MTDKDWWDYDDWKLVDGKYQNLGTMPPSAEDNHEGEVSTRVETSAPKPEIISIGKLIDQYPTLREPIIEGLLRRGERACINAKAKSGKS